MIISGRYSIDPLPFCTGLLVFSSDMMFVKTIPILQMYVYPLLWKLCWFMRRLYLTLVHEFWCSIFPIKNVVQVPYISAHEQTLLGLVYAHILTVYYWYQTIISQHLTTCTTFHSIACYTCTTFFTSLVISLECMELSRGCSTKIKDLNFNWTMISIINIWS